MDALLKVSLINMSNLFREDGLISSQNVLSAEAILQWVYQQNKALSIYLDKIIELLRSQNWAHDDIQKIVSIIQKIENAGEAYIKLEHNLQHDFFHQIYENSVIFRIYYYVLGLQRILITYTAQGDIYILAKEKYRILIDELLNYIMSKGYNVQYSKKDSEKLWPFISKNNQRVECPVNLEDILQAEVEIAAEIQK